MLIRRKYHIAGAILMLLQFFILRTATAQFIAEPYKAEVTRILFLLDGSGSMNDDWGGRNKFEIARNLLEKAVDSLSKTGHPVEFGLRVFGHQSPRELHDCEDSRLEVAVRPDNANQIRSALAQIKPSGYSPIAYSLFLAAGDFPDTRNVKNIIILITDGLENCEGDPCASSEALRNKRVTLKPFIIGLGLDDADKDQFDCVGTYYDAENEKGFEKALQVVVSQAMDNTTVQINLLDHLGRATQTKIELTLYDAFSGEIRYNLVHSFLKDGSPDTLYLDPTGKYDVAVHTSPPVYKRNIELIPGRHNVIAVETPQGQLQLGIEGNPGFNTLQCLVRDPHTHEIIYVQNFNTSHDYIAGTYDLELLTLPRRVVHDFQILPGVDNKLSIKNPGKLFVFSHEAGLLSIYTRQSGILSKVYEWENFDGRATLQVQPGEYVVVFRSAMVGSVDGTREHHIKVFSGKNSTLRFEP